MLVHDWPFLQRDESFGRRWFVSEGAVRTLGVVVTTPLLDDDLGLLQGVEDFPVQQFVAKAGVEALDVAILPRGTDPDLKQETVQTEQYQKALELMEEEAEEPSWEWDDEDCGSFPEYGV
jgi:hypothetical protein